MNKFSFENFLPDNDWKKIILKDFDQSILKKIEKNLNKKNFDIICPKIDNIFKAFEYTPFKNVKVVIMGQDPYHGPGQAHGLSFSVPDGIKVPPSLKNIYKLINTDLNIPIPSNGNLSNWAKEGVLLLNSALTVDLGKPMSHRDIQWEYFTSEIINYLNNNANHIVFMAWGLPAQKTLSLVNPKKHLVLTSVHPSPLSAYRGFFESKHFIECNRYLKENGKSINWNLAK